MDNTSALDSSNYHLRTARGNNYLKKPEFSKLGYWNCNLKVPHSSSSVLNDSKFNYIVKHCKFKKRKKPPQVSLCFHSTIPVFANKFSLPFRLAVRK